MGESLSEACLFAAVKRHGIPLLPPLPHFCFPPWGNPRPCQKGREEKGGSPETCGSWNGIRRFSRNVFECDLMEQKGYFSSKDSSFQSVELWRFFRLLLFLFPPQNSKGWPRGGDPSSLVEGGDRNAAGGGEEKTKYFISCLRATLVGQDEEAVGREERALLFRLTMIMHKKLISAAASISQKNFE